MLRCQETELLFRGERSKRFAANERVAQQKLRQLDRAVELRDLSICPSADFSRPTQALLPVFFHTEAADCE
jgi:plasmid maintenance system killer protein